MCDAFGPPVLIRPFQQYQVCRTRSSMYIIGIDKVLREYSILKIPRKEDPGAGLELLDGEARYPLEQLETQKQQLGRDGSLEKVATASGLVGFIRFLQGHYLILITKHKKVGKIGHHYVLSIEATLLVSLFAESTKLVRDEKAFVDQFNNLNLSKDFYFSYSYELSRTAQQNLVDAMHAASGELRRPFHLEKDPLKHHRFVWNYHHMSPLLEKEGWQHWCLSIIHGFFAYTKCSSFGWTFEVALIARRSRFHAGTRYRKRGVNVDGQVANDVETEQLLCDDSTRQLACGHIMSFVQVRGSVPLFWAQEATKLNPKPPVVYPRCDPTLSATRLHFADLLERYGTPQLVVNLMKAKKVDSYEVRLSKHFESAIERMNRELPPPERILYRPFDMKNHAKSSIVYDVFIRLAESVVSRVGFFHTSRGLYGRPERVQNGVVRTNCMDCLDRTNVLQFFVGLEVLQQQLTALNLLPEPRLDFDSQVVFVLQELYDLMGDHLALQYAGSVAHKKNPLLGSRPRMMTSTKELLTSIHRHYHNTWNDNEKQAAMNFFLGIYKPSEHPRLWELDCDSWVHHRVLHDNYDPGAWWEAPLRHYARNMEVLQGPCPCPGAMHPFGWFRVVHSVWKLTWFEKLLSRLEATFVQNINASNRRLSTLRPFRAIAQKGPPRPAAARALPEAVPGHPRVVDDADLHAYQAYIDLRRWNRLAWSMLPMGILEVPDLGSAGFSFARSVEIEGGTADGASVGDALEGKSPLELLRWHASLHQRERVRQRVRGQPDRIDKPERDEARRRLRHVLEAYKTLNEKVCQRSASAFEQHELLDQHGRARGGGSRGAPEHATWQITRRQSRLMHAHSMRLRLCKYCDVACSVSVADGERGGEAGGATRHSQQLCPRHQRRAQELESLCQAGSLQLPARGARSEKPRGVAVVCVPQGSGGQRPWEGWLRVTQGSPLSLTGRSSNKMHASDWPHHVSELEIPTASFSVYQAVEYGGSDGLSTGEGCGSSARDGNGVTSPVQVAPRPQKAAGWDDGSKVNGWRRQAWSFAFPHATPPPPEEQDLGLPAWWRDATEEPPPPRREVVTHASTPRQPPDAPRRALMQATRDNHLNLPRRRSAPHASTPSSHAGGASQQKDQKDLGVARGGWSIFHEQSTRRVLEEALDAEHSDGLQITGQILPLKHRRVRSVAF